MRALHLGDRRFLTLGILAIASVLEICGCNPLRSGHQTEISDSASARWAAVLNGCASCLSKDDRAARDEDRLVERNTAGQPSHDSPSEPASIGKQFPSFYDPDPETPIEEVRDGPSMNTALPLEDKPGPWTIPESVFFVYKKFVTGDGRTHRVLSATAFVISVPDLTHRTSARFLVTARHVVDPEWAHCSEKNPRSIDIRLNRRNGGVGYETIPLQNDHLPVFFAPPDGTSDVAVIRLDQPVIPNLQSYKVFDTPFRMLPTDSELRSVHSDQPIMTAGLLSGPSPDTGIYPISHGGILSGNSTQAVTMQCGTALGPTQLHVWFINAAIPQGVSGAPVFTSMNREAGGSKTPVLLGVQAVVWPDRGVAGMTPSPVLSDLIHQALHDAKQQMDFSKGTKP